LDKTEAEEIFMEANIKNEFPLTIVRPAYTYDTIIPVSLGHNCFTVPQRYLDGKPVLIAGDGTNLFTFTHSRDFANALIGLIGNKNAIGEDFHITTDEWLTWLDITDMLLDNLNIKNPKIIHIPVDDILKMEIPVSSNMSISYLGKAFAGQRMWCDNYDNSKIKKVVPNWQAKTTFKDGISETLKWMFEKDIRRRINPNLNNLLEDLTVKYNK
jgi:nucleoside-diphosphate-sugar epimerase